MSLNCHWNIIGGRPSLVWALLEGIARVLRISGWPRAGPQIKIPDVRKGFKLFGRHEWKIMNTLQAILGNVCNTIDDSLPEGRHTHTHLHIFFLPCLVRRSKGQSWTFPSMCKVLTSQRLIDEIANGSNREKYQAQGSTFGSCFRKSFANWFTLWLHTSGHAHSKCIAGSTTSRETTTVWSSLLLWFS